MSSDKIPSESSTNPINSILKLSSRKSVSPEKIIPKEIGAYEIKEKITEGGYCKIYLGKSKYTGDKVAIKIIDKNFFLENMEDLLLIKRQIEILKIIKHRNILTLYEIYESLDFIFLVMEYIPGKNLCEMIVTKRRFREEEAQKIFVQIVDALYYLHKMNICHRNITSNHILIDINNIPKLISFSYSTFYSKNQELKDSFGSLCHACPEIISELPYNPELSDTWSLGTVLYTMVAGYLPFSEENDEKNKDLIVSGKVEFPKEMSNKLKDLLKHMMEPNPKRRYDFIKIMKHPWFKPYNDKLIGGCNPLKMIVPVDNKIIEIIKQFGFDKEIVELDIKKNKYNKSTGLYKLLVKKANILGFHSLSDYGSKEYLSYRDNKNNYYIEGDINYEKYLEQVQKKMESIEKQIFQFQEKEENIIQELNNLEEKIRNENNKEKNSSNVNANEKQIRGKSPEQNSKIIKENNINKVLKKIKSCGNFHKVVNSLVIMNQSSNNKNSNIKIRPRRTHFSNNNESWQDTSIIIKKRKSYLNNSTFFESLLKKTHPDNLRKSLMRKNIISDINQVIIEEKENNNNKEKKKSIRFSLSFSDDDNNEDNLSNESDDNISKVDSRQLSMFDEDGIKFLKELKMIGSNYVYKGKKKSSENKENEAKFKNTIITNFAFNTEKNENKKEENINDKKEENDLEQIYSTIKSDNNNDNNEIDKIKKSEQRLEINKINEIIILNENKEKDKENVELCYYYNDKKKVSKLNINNSLTEDLCSIEYIHNKFQEKNILVYNNGTKKIKKLDDIDNDIIIPKNCVIDTIQNKNNDEFIISQIMKEHMLMPNNSNIINLNSLSNSNEEIITKNNNNKNILKKVNSLNNPIKKNIIKYPNSMNNLNKNRIKDKIKLAKKTKINCKKYKSDKCHPKHNEELNITNISDISEIKPLSIVTPTYLNTNIENKENILMNNNIIDNKSFQSKSQISNLSMTHENNIFLGNNNHSLFTYRINNYFDYDLNNFYMVHLDNYNKNTYSQNHILNIKKKNLADKLKEEIQKSIDKKQIKSSLLISMNTNENKKKSSTKNIHSTKSIPINNNNNIYFKNRIPVNSSKSIKQDKNINENNMNSIENMTKTIRYKAPEYVNFIKIRHNKMSNSMIKRSNGKSVEILKNNNNAIKMNKSRKNVYKKKEINFPEKFIFCSSVRNFNNFCCFNKKHQRYFENCNTIEKKPNKSTSKRYCVCDKNKKDISCVKSNGKKIDTNKEKMEMRQISSNQRSYLNIYEKDKKYKYKIKREKMINDNNNKVNDIVSIYHNNKRGEFTYKRIFIKNNL